MPLPLSITKETSENGHGRYVARLEGSEAEAELTFTQRREGLISADHVGTPEELRGQGIAAELVEHLVAEARREGFRVIPKCPYVVWRYSQHPEWQDVFTSKPHEPTDQETSNA